MTDYIIIGGGSAGCVLAARLTENPHLQVTLLEAGGRDDSPLIHCPGGLALLARTGQFNWAFPTEPQPGLAGRRGYQPRGRVLGGSSSINAMIYARGHPGDYDRWGEDGNPGWSWDEVRPYFLKAEHNERGVSDHHAQGGPLNVADLRSPNPFAQDFIEAAVQAGVPRNPDFNGASLEGAGWYQVTQKNGERFSAAKAYLGPALSRPNLTVITGARARRILLQGKRAVGVEFSQGGAVHRLSAAREVLLCAGALQSPQLLMLSGIGDHHELLSHGIGVLHELPAVGRHLQDHVDVVQVVDVPGRSELFGLSWRGALAALAGVSQWRRHRSGLLTTNFAEAGAFVRSRADETIPDLQLHFVVGKLVDHGRKTVWGHGYSCHVCLLRPRSEGRVSLQGRDPDEAPAIDPNFLADHDDLERMIQGFRLMRHILQQPALARHGGRELQRSARAQDDFEIEAFLRDHADTIYHPSGTCRMGPDAADAVVDARLKVHGLQGLRVVDASIMPRLVSGNTNAPTMMVAERAAEWIAHDALLA